MNNVIVKNLLICHIGINSNFARFIYMHFEWLNQSLQVAVAVTEGNQSGNLSVKLSSTKYPVCDSKVICLSIENPIC